MTGRQDELLDAAIRVLGRNGSRGLTHRAVDAEAGLAAGSTSNYFRTRSALVAGIVARLEARDYQEWNEQAAPAPVTSRTELVEVLTRLVTMAATDQVVRTRARHAVFIEASVAGPNSTIARSVERSRSNLTQWGTSILADLGVPDPVRAARMLVDYLDGVIVHQLTKEALEPTAIGDDIAMFLAGLKLEGTGPATLGSADESGGDPARESAVARRQVSGNGR